MNQTTNLLSRGVRRRLATLMPALLPALLLAIAGCSEPGYESLFNDAKQQLAGNDNRAAVIQLKAALQKNPDAAEARFLLGKILFDVADYGGSAIELRKARELKHPDVLVVPILARAMLRRGEAKALVDEFRALSLPDAQAMADLQTSLAVAHSMLGSLTEAEAALAEALKLSPNEAAAQAFQVRLLAGKGDIDAAAALSAELVERHATDAGAWKARGDVLRQIGSDMDAALAAFRRAIALDRRDLESHANAVGILLSRGDVEASTAQLAELQAVAPRHPQTQFLVARLAYQRDDLTAARVALQDVLRLMPDHVGALEIAGAIELRSGSLAVAQSHLEKALQLAPLNRPVRRRLAAAQMRAGKPTDALRTLELALASLPDAATLSLAAEAHLLNGDIKRAEEHFAKAAKLDPKDPRNRIAAALASIRQGRAASGIESLKAVAAADSGIGSDMALISVHLARSEFKAALSAAKALGKKQPDSAHAAHVLGRVQLATGDALAARASFERSFSVDPMYYPAVLSLSLLDVGAGQVEAAVKRFEAMVQADPKHVSALIALADLKARAGAPTQEVKTLLERAVAAAPDGPGPKTRLAEYLLYVGEPRQALAVAQQGAEAHPRDDAMLDVFGRAQLANRDYQQAIITFGRLLALQPDSTLPHLRMTEVHVAAGNLDLARQSLGRALSRDPRSLEAQKRLIALEITLGRLNEALTLAQTVKNQRPKEAVGHVFEGDVQVARKNGVAAVSAYRAALGIAPSTDVAMRLHGALDGLGRKEEAGRFATEWKQRHPNDARFVFHLGETALAHRDYADAEARFQDMLALTPNNAMAHNNLAWTMLRQGKSGALEHAESAYKLRPDIPGIMDTLAFVLSAQGRHERAIDLQKRAIAADPKSPVFRLGLARIYVKAGRKDDAEAELKALAALGERFAGQKDVKEMLKELRGG